MAYKNFPERVFTAEEQAANRAWMAQRTRESKAAEKRARAAEAAATFSEEMVPEGFPAFYYINNEVFAFSSAAVDLDMVWYRCTTEQARCRLFRPADMTVRNVGAELLARAEAGDFQEKKKY